MERTELSRIAYDPSRPLGEKIRGWTDERLRREPVRATLGIARNLGEKLRLANPALANKPQLPDINKVRKNLSSFCISKRICALPSTVIKFTLAAV